MNIQFRLTSLVPFLTLTLLFGTDINAEVGSKKQTEVLDRIQANTFSVESSVQSDFDPSRWQRTNQKADSIDLDIDEVIVRLRKQLSSTGLSGTQQASFASAISVNSTNSHSNPIGKPLQNQQKQAFTVHRRKNNRTVSQLQGKLLNRASLAMNFRASKSKDDDKTIAREFLNAYKGLLRIDNPDRELQLSRTQTDKLGRRHLRYSQVYHNLPVWPAELMVHLDPEGNVDLMTGAYVSTPRKLVTKPSLTTEQATDLAIEAVPNGENAEVPEPTLIIYAPLDRISRLAWKMELEVSLSASWLVVVDAHNGEILDAYNQIMEAKVVGSGMDLLANTRPLNLWQEDGRFYMVDASKQMFKPTSNPPQPTSTDGGIIILDMRNEDPKERPHLFPVTSASSNSGWIPDAVSASFGLSETYDYFLERHGRNSIDGQGGTMIAVVRTDQALDNAYWNGSAMFFGDTRPWAAAIDVVAHELTHGITQASAELVYKNQSGALNEAFSDIFGEMVEARTNGAPDWIKGGNHLGVTIQNYRNPSAVTCLPNTPCPSKITEYINTTLDNGGVHINSSIINHAFYKLAEGLPGAIGLRDAERVFYRTLTTKLSPQSQFVDARRGAIASAEELFGANSNQTKKTAEAFDAVEIIDNVATPEPVSIPEVSGPDSTLMVFFDSDSQAYFLGRRENALGDPVQGGALSQFSVSRQRPSVSGDGSFAVFVDSINDICFIQTNPTEDEDCLGFQGLVFSATMSPDGRFFAFVFLGDQGQPENSIRLIDLVNDTTQTFTLPAPLLDGGTIDIAEADVMDFSADGQSLVYDAFNQIRFANGSSLGLWSIYKLEIETGIVTVVVPPTSGLDLGNPFLAQTNDNALTFEAFDPDVGSSTIIAGNLFSGEFSQVAFIPSSNFVAAPGFTGDDSAIVYTIPDFNPTAYSLFRQPLADDHLTPVGSASLWLSDSEFGVVYRRGQSTGPETFRLNVTVSGNGSGIVSSSPSGIICGNDCSEEFLQDTIVSLVAKPSSSTVFSGWSGAGCSGTKSCTISIKENKLVTATFTRSNSAPNDIFGDARLFAMQQYRDFFHREGDLEGIEHWRKRIDDGVLSRAEVINLFLNSAEFSDRVSPIVRLYFAYFLRIPDFPGLNYWLDAFQNGMPLMEISEAFAKSEEFIVTYGELSDAEFVALVYQNILRREPDSAGFDYWIDQLGSGMSRGEVMVGFSESSEYQAHITNSVLATMIYVGMLQRSPDQGGFDFWKGQFNSGASPVEVIEGFLNSIEYSDRFI